jgi:hypothetical protein
MTNLNTTVCACPAFKTNARSVLPAAPPVVATVEDSNALLGALTGIGCLFTRMAVYAGKAVEAPRGRWGSCA